MRRIYAVGIFLLGLLCMAPSLFSSEDPGQRLFRDKRGSIVMLTSPSHPNHGGTGFEVKAPSGAVYTVTNGHVCEIAEGGLVAAWADGLSRPRLLHVLEVSETTDLCILEPLAAPKALSVAHSFDPSAHLFVLGHPHLKPTTLSDGYAIARGPLDVVVGDDPASCKYTPATQKDFFGERFLCIRTLDAIDSTITIFPGNSGSPVMDADGEVVGVIFAGSNATNWGSFIPLDILEDFLSIY